VAIALVESQIKLIPSKEEFFGAMSELMGKIKSSSLPTIKKRNSIAKVSLLGEIRNLYAKIMSLC